MNPTITLGTGSLVSHKAPLLAIALSDGADLSGHELDGTLGGVIARATESRDFRGARDETLLLAGGASGPRMILLVGTGAISDRSGALRRAAAIASRQACKLGSGSMTWYAGELNEREAEAVALGLVAGAWEYTETKTQPPENERRAPLASVTIATTESAAARRGLTNGLALAEGHSLARRLAMMPGNLCTPDYLAETAREIAGRHGMEVTVWGRSEMQEEGMGSFLAVAQGTPQDPKLIVLKYNGARNDSAPVALVGKGLCFDSGGISIKPPQNMELMKFDMCGAAGVLGALETIGTLKLDVNVIGVIGATTNMPSGTAFKPGDVVRSHLGKYIEVVNTDAEGRMVLADLLSYVRRFNPAVTVDAATLTGAVVIALGHTATGVFSSDDKLTTEILDAGKRAGEPGWPLPLWDEYKELIKSDVADMKNAGGRAAGSTSAAMFLKEFTEGMPWIHLDIAGTAYSETDLVALPKGPTGVPVGTFVEFVRGRAS
ncbi:MAG TPA: leucyl aminopeptidase [Gemmatimonadaceae bacterium]|nr:leucyl aminopeptidase [Gemmatimonadaceae bacterium]